MRFKICKHLHGGHQVVSAEPPRTTDRPPAPPAGPAGVSRLPVSNRLVILPDGPVIEPGPLPVEAQIVLRVMGEDLETARELIKAMRPVDRAILSFYLNESGSLINQVNEGEGRY